MKDNRYNQKKHGFTLIELLVVISIIALLLSILMPALSRAREQAKAAVCKTRMKGLGLAVNMYAEDNNGIYVTQDWLVTGGISDPGGHWFARLGPYTGGEKGQEEKMNSFMRCPSGQAIKDFQNQAAYEYIATDYGLQMYPGGNTTVRTSSGLNVIAKTAKLTSIQQPGKFAVTFDFYYGDKAWQDSTGRVDITDGTIEWRKWYEYVVGYDAQSDPKYRDKVFRHSEGINTSYVDTHVDDIINPDWWEDMATPSSVGWANRPVAAP